MNGGRLFSDFSQGSSFDWKVGTCCFSNQVLFNVTAAACGNILSTSFISSVFFSAKNLLSRLSGVKYETLFSSVANNFCSNSMGWLISINNKVIMFSLSVSTLLFAIFIFLPCQALFSIEWLIAQANYKNLWCSCLIRRLGNHATDWPYLQTQDRMTENVQFFKSSPS